MSLKVINPQIPTGAFILSCLVLILLTGPLPARALEKELIFPVPHLTPVENRGILKVGDPAPDFTLTAIDGNPVRLSSYRGKKIVVLSFVPAAFTPVCSAQWPMYNMARALFQKYHAEVIGISTDNRPSLYAWTRGMGNLWFKVLSDFWPHGRVCKLYGVLRQNGTAERALFVIDRQGIIRWIDIHDINQRPPLDDLDRALAEVASTPVWEPAGADRR